MSAPEVTVRPARPADVPRIHEMVRRLAEYEKLAEFVSGTPDMLRDALFGEGPRLDALVAESASGLVGYALFYPVFGSFNGRWRLWLEDLFVEPAVRGSGAGRLLLAELSRVALARGCAAVEWFVLDWNEPALGFYQRLGASRISVDWFHYRLAEDGMRSLVESAGR